MNLKKLILILIILLIFGCNPSSLIPNHTSIPTKSEAKLKLDTKGHTALIRDILVTKSGDIISASDDKTIRVWDSKTGKEKRKVLGEIGAGLEGQIFAIALSPNNKFLAVGGYLGNYRGDKPKEDEEAHKIRIYNYHNGKLLKILKSHTNIVNDLAFSPDGKFLISGSADKTAKIWRVKDFNLIDTIKFHKNEVYAVKIIQKYDNYFAITAGYDNRIALYDIQTKEIIRSDTKLYKLMFLAFSKKKHIAVSGKGKEIQIYDSNLNPIKTIYSETKPAGVAYSPNGKYLIAGTGLFPRNVNIYSVDDDYKKIQSFKKHTNLTMAVAFLDNSTAISGGGNNSEIYIWNIKSGKVLNKIEGVGARVWSVGVIKDKIAWGNKWQGGDTHQGGTKLQKFINLKNFQVSEKLTIGSGEFQRISTTYKKYSLSYREGGAYKYSDAILDIKENNKVVKSIKRGSTDGYRHRCYGFYKDYIVSGGANGHLTIYNLKGQEIANLIGHTGEIWSIAIDGDRLVSGSDDQTIRIWNLSKLKVTSEARKVKNLYPQLNLFISKNNDWVAWTPQGFYDSSKGGEKYIGYHINQGSDKEARFLDINRFRKQFYRPDLITKVINGKDISRYAEGDIELGINICELGKGVSNFSIYIDDNPIKTTGKTKIVNNCTLIIKDITIPYGKHTIGVDATNQKGNIISNRPTITIINTQKM